MFKANDVKESLVNLLGYNANGQYFTIGYESLPKSASAYEGDRRTVRAFLSKGNFPRSGGSDGRCTHDVNMSLEIVCTAAANIDAEVLLNENSTDSERALAMEGSKHAAFLADKSFDELCWILWNIIMSGKNRFLGMKKYSVKDRFVTGWEKDRIVPQGGHVILTGYMSLEFSVIEETTIGITPRKNENSETNLITDEEKVAKTATSNSDTE